MQTVATRPVRGRAPDGSRADSGAELWYTSGIARELHRLQRCARLRLPVLAGLALAGLSVFASGCAFDAQILVRFDGSSPVVVTQSLNPQLIPRRVEGVTRRRGQVVGINCSVTLVYDVREATGSAVLAQRYLVRMRTRPLRRGTPYALDCMGPLILQLPADASGIAATATSNSGLPTVLPLKAPVASIALAFRRRLRPEPKAQLAVVRWPQTLAPGTYQLELAFSLGQARAFREKAISTASVSCGRSRYLQPILPPVTTMARAPAFRIVPSGNTTKLLLPRVAGSIGSYAETKRTLSCVR